MSVSVIVGGGAAGYFAAINGAEAAFGRRFVLLEATRRPLTKVKISGGGRCNVTHHCFDPAELVKNYPRGAKELLGPFSRFQPRDTVAWFEKRGVRLKVEEDGRMFPVTDDSATIVECLQSAARDAGVEVRLGAMVKEVTRGSDGFEIRLRDETLAAASVLLATGGAPPGFELARRLGHTIVSPVPSLFTFEIDDPRIDGLAGVSVERARVALRFEGDRKPRFQTEGPLLITHWGMSGPAVLRLSAFAARELHEHAYQAEALVAWLPGTKMPEIERLWAKTRKAAPRRLLQNENPTTLPRRLWERLVQAAGLEDVPWAEADRSRLEALAREVLQGVYRVSGKGEFKEEFVTAGGVSRREVDFRTMESKIVPGLHFAGEILDIDGVTGGFNFQNAWTSGFIAGRHMAGV